MSKDWLHNFLIYLFAIGSFFSLAYLFTPQKRLQVISFRFTVALWGLQTILIVLWLGNWYSFRGLESFFLYTWALLTFSLILIYMAELNLLLVFANVSGLVIWISYSLFLDTSSSEIQQLLLSKWIFIHVIFAMISYAALSLSSIFAGLYLLTNYLLKKKKGLHWLRQSPSLGQLQLLSKRLVKIGLIFLLVSISQGIIIAYHRFSIAVFIDPKTIGSLLVLLLYSWLIYLNQKKGWHGRKLAWWNFVVILSVVINYFLFSNSFSFHHWM